ncbi:MAG TPA: exodeoxyribonuclease VII large subunit, partial [bacterium]|nr:exodeoxyribonuclease VII large subunit [bacterium]
MDLFSVSNENSSDLGQRQEKKPVIYSITEITRLIKTHLEDSFPAITVSGEISNLTRASSGHVYFTLKDAGAQIKAVIWKSSSASQSDALKDGKKVIARGNIAVYEKGGYYQITVQKIQQEGIGALQEA